MLGPLLILLFGSILSMAASCSLLFKSEAVRGGGRVVLGFAWVVMAYALAQAAVTFGPLAPLVVVTGVMLGISGVVTLGSGVRKYLRRNLPAA